MITREPCQRLDANSTASDGCISTLDLRGDAGFFLDR